MQVPVIAVVDASAPGGFRLINESDFNPDEHEPFKGKGVKLPPPPTDSALDSDTPPPTVKPSEPLSEMTLTQLRALAQVEEIKGRTGMNQEELIDALAERNYTR